MADRDELRELRQQAHDAGIEGNSKMNEQQLREALKKVQRGMEPMKAKAQARS
ncbi:MAG TPA: Rho termination factor N-terminal domain-containing protein [Micromonospora sp.]